MIFFYVCAGGLTLISTIVWMVWPKKFHPAIILISGGSAFITAAIFHAVAFHGMTADVETWSGRVDEVIHYPEWVEEYESCHEECSGSGKNESCHTECHTEYRTHSEYWVAEINYGQAQGKAIISEYDYRQMAHWFGGGIATVAAHNVGFYSGDDNIYPCQNATGFVVPATKLKSFTNRIKAGPSVFSYSKVPVNIKVFKWPENPDWKNSQRLLGQAGILFSPFKFDQFNSVVGIAKKVNVILVGFGSGGAEMGQYQEAAWIGGKKNDLVITFGGGGKSTPATWAHVFGWSESEFVKRNLETLFVSNPLSDALLPLMEKEIRLHYTKKDWHKFDYISISPPGWSYWVFILIVGICQFFAWFGMYSGWGQHGRIESYAYGYGYNKYSFPKYRKY